MAEKVTTMVLKVDLECSKCFKKVKKTLSKFPQIRDQVYDEKQNTVTIKVVCCSPEMIRDKICSKGSVSIKSIEIKPPEKPEEKKSEKPKEPAEKKKEPEKPKKPEKKKEPVRTRYIYVDRPPKPKSKPKPEPEVKQPKPAERAAGYPPFYPFGEGLGEGQCYHGGPPPECYYGRPVYGFYGNRPDYFCEEKSSACTIM